jgi:hypothetical protein
MYTLCVIPVSGNGRIVELLQQVMDTRADGIGANAVADNDRKKSIDNDWVHGGHGLSLFSTDNGYINVGIKRGVVWSERYCAYHHIICFESFYTLCYHHYLSHFF